MRPSRSSSSSLSSVSDPEESEELSSENLDPTEFADEKDEFDDGPEEEEFDEAERKGDVEVEGKLNVLSRSACAVSIERRDLGGRAGGGGRAPRDTVGRCEELWVRVARRFRRLRRRSRLFVEVEEFGPGSERTRRWRGRREGLRGGNALILIEDSPSESSPDDPELESDPDLHRSSRLDDRASAQEYLRVMGGRLGLEGADAELGSEMATAAGR